MSCPHGIWHEEDCDVCSAANEHDRAYGLLFKENGKLRAEVERLTAGTALTAEQREQFANLAKPLIQWLNENTDPHHSILITPVSAELVGGVTALQTEEYVRE